MLLLALVPGALLAASCIGARLYLGEGPEVCAVHKGERDAAMFCDAADRLIMCRSGKPVAAARGLNACAEIEGLRFLISCNKGERSTPHRARAADLVPCAACQADSDEPVFVSLAEGQCALPDAGVRDVDASEDDTSSDQASSSTENDDGASSADDQPTADVKPSAELYGPCPCAKGLRCDPDFAACMPLAECELSSSHPCPKGEVCLLDETPAVCVPLDAFEGHGKTPSTP